MGLQVSGSILARSLTALGSLVVLVAAGGCSGGEPVSTSGVVPEFEGIEDGVAFQREALSDGVVTQAELERGIRAFLGCVYDAGYIAAGPVWEPKYRILFYRTGFSGPENEPDFMAINDSCYETYARDLDGEYQTAHKYDYPGVDADAAEYRECLSEAGWLTVEEGTSFQDLDYLVLQTEQEKGPSPCDNPFELVPPADFEDWPR